VHVSLTVLYLLQLALSCRYKLILSDRELGLTEPFDAFAAAWAAASSSSNSSSTSSSTTAVPTKTQKICVGKAKHACIKALVADLQQVLAAVFYR
jgi:hypothetical protein